MNILSCSILIQFKKALNYIAYLNEIVDHFTVRHFNLHHFIWEDIETRIDVKSHELISLMNKFRLTSNLSKNTLTYFYFQGFEFMIEFCLSTKRLTKQIFICKIVDINHISDYMFIEIILDLSINQCLFSKRFSWNCFNQTKFERVLKQKLSNVLLEDARSKKFDIVITFFNKVIYNVIFLFVFKKIISSQAILGFDEKCHET